MRSIRWATIAVAAILILSCFFPWVVIESRNIVISGVNAEGTNYGKPGYFNIILTSIVIIFSFFPRLWAQRISLFVAAFNMGWTLRNFIILGTCEAGECPVRKTAFYIFFLSGILLLLSILFQKIKVPHTNENAAA